jgi:hypothetical protein
MKKSPLSSRRISPKPSITSRESVSDSDMFNYNGPVQWTTKNISPYRGVNLKASPKPAEQVISD